MRKLRIMLGLGLLGAVALVASTGTPPVATAARNPLKASIRCRKAIGQSVLQAVTAGLKAIQRCHVQRLKGRPTGDCNSLSGAAFSQAKARAQARMNLACKEGDPVLANYGGALPSAAFQNRIFAVIQQELEESGAELQDSPTFTDGDKKSQKVRRKCHGMLGTGRTAVVQSVLKSATKCQQRIDKRAQSFGPIDASCLGGAGGAGSRASSRISRACGSFGGAEVGSCPSLPGCLMTAAETIARRIARLTYGGPAACGNELIDAGETCDDGNTDDGDGCSSTCQAPLPPRCGDHVVNQPTEECDDDDAAFGVFGDEPGENCYQCKLNVCGDGNLDQQEPGIEECDDGNTVAGDGCTNCRRDARTCGPNGLPVTLGLRFSQAVATFVSGTGLELRYPGDLSIPGSGPQPSVRARVTSLIPDFTARPNDRDTNADGVDDLLRVDLTSALSLINAPGEDVARVQFDCPQGTAVQPSDLVCSVAELIDMSGLPLDPSLRAQASCEVTLGGTSVTTTTTTPTIVTTTSTPVSTTTTTRPPLCGNNTVDAGEECDDGNSDPNDGCTNSCTSCGNGITTLPETCDSGPGQNCANCNCPQDCQIEQCVPTGATQSLTIVSSRPDLTSILLLLDYPEGRVEIPGLGFDVIGSISNTPGESTDALDLGIGSAEHALRLLVSASFTFDTTTIATVSFRGCAGAPPAGPSDFICTVLEAGDGNFMAAPGVTCSVTIP
jgi:cysteine-rich repeat protein